MLKALVVDDEYLVRAGLCQTVDWEEYGIQIVGEACNGKEGLEMALRLRPEIIVTDIRMPHMNGLELLRHLQEQQLDCVTIVLSGYDEFQYAQEAMRLGASHYLLKPVNIDELIETLQRVAQSFERLREERIAFDRLKRETPALSSHFWLKLLFGEGLSRADIAEKLALLGMEIAAETTLTIGVVSIDSAAESIAAGQPPGHMEHCLEEALQPLAYTYTKIVRSSSSEWTVIAANSHPGADAVARFHEAGHAMVQALRAQQLPVAVGYATAASIYADLHAVFLTAREAAEAARLRQQPVQYGAEDQLPGIRKEVHNALSYIRVHYARNITVDLVAESVHISPTHLMHLFRKELNKTFYECLTEFRIEEAKRLLRHSSYRVYEVGSQVGFGDAKYFSQIFKKMTGLSPSDYAKNYT
ncbi:response regulator [Paenibacillus sp. SYP-B4298]|uniref:response regulator n=1 Tax=Paenibacillus sp. SYP-B4298 TaxID=2996034 RepID=UPI0022DE1F28|nr:response regulator [Paenibacillus sp. SYP-B4298]